MAVTTCIGGIDAAVATRLSGGFSPDAQVLTQDGEMPVSFVAPGDKMITRDTGLAPVIAVRRIRVGCTPVRVSAASLGSTRPTYDLRLPGAQRVLVRDWRAQALYGQSQAMIPLDRLCDGNFIVREALQDLDIIQILCAGDHVLYVDGLELASHQPDRAEAA